jgi:NAD(P)-dependent dehydrogenase (short-subunit alcohol dehydrogenase family)
MSLEFLGKTVVITGGTSGIGLATVKRFVDAGAYVLATGQAQTKRVAEEMKQWTRCKFVESDISSMADLDALVATFKNEFKSEKLDVLVSNAGIAPFQAIGDVSRSGVDETFAINTIGPLFLVQKFLPFLDYGSRIVFTTSALSAQRVAGCSVYSATKAALVAIMETLAIELAPKGISVNAVSPGPIDTMIHRSHGLSDAQRDGLKASIIQKIPAARYGQPEEVARAIFFLASEEAAYCRGTNLAMDGGWRA